MKQKISITTGDKQMSGTFAVAATSRRNSKSVIPIIRMSRHVACEVMRTVGANPPETGGILLGPLDSNDITEFYFDITAKCGGVTYEPDHLTLQRKMKQEWIPAKRDMKGFVHSHPSRFDQLSGGDLIYIKRLLKSNPEMPYFVAPIVIPQDYRWRAIVVLREQPDVQHPTQIELF